MGQAHCVLILGHRGASADFPENTLEAFAGAVEQGADGVELDVMRCSSGELVVCHDEKLDRLAGRQWEVDSTPWWKLQTADVGSSLGFKPARIPLLEDVFEALPSTMLVNVEIKCITLDDRGLTEGVGRFITENDLIERTLVSSFSASCLFRLAAQFPEIRRGQLIDPDSSFFAQRILTPSLARESINVHHSQVTQERVDDWHSHGMKVVVWTVDDPAMAASLRNLGVDILITNRPKFIRESLS